MNIDQSGEQGFFIDFRQLIALVQRGTVKEIPSYQKIAGEFPSLIAARIDADYDRKIFFSHRWDDPKEDAPPDPRGWQLEAICAYGAELAYTETRPACFWYDYCSLPQKPRTPAQQQIFSKGLDHIARLCRDCTLVVLISNTQKDDAKNLREMLARGWVLTELFIGTRHERVSIALFEGTAYLTHAKLNRPKWHTLVPDLQDLMPYDNEDVIHEWLVHSGVACTNGADLWLLAKILRRELGGVLPSAAAPRKLVFNTVEVMDDKTVAGYAIDRHGLSGHFPDTYFETSGAAGQHVVRAHKRPALGKVGEWRQLTDEQVRELRIDESNGRSAMYPGIVFVFHRASSHDRVDVKPGLLAVR